jgi:RNA polymerase sigma-70 factor (ECF subfamily)
MKFNRQLAEDLARRAQIGIDQDTRRITALRGCMKKLSERDRDLIELRYQEGASVKKVAQHVNRGVKGIYKSLNRIRWQLLECIRRSLVMEDHS